MFVRCFEPAKAFCAVGNEPAVLVLLPLGGGGPQLAVDGWGFFGRDGSDDAQPLGMAAVGIEKMHNIFYNTYSNICASVFHLHLRFLKRSKAASSLANHLILL